MKILSLNTSSYHKHNNKPVFRAGGKPIDLIYIYKNRSNLLPQRVLDEVKSVLEKGEDNLPSLLDIHKKVYKKLLDCETLEKIKENYPEFSNIKENIVFKRDTVYKKNFDKLNCNDNFGLKIIQNYWAKVMTKDEIAKSLGMKNRGSLDGLLKQINFVGFPKNYNKLLQASDKIGNQEIASKMTAWNTLHPDLMRAKNKHAAQSCKTQEYREAQSIRIKEYDKTHPERREKISISNKKAWELCPNIKDAMKNFAQSQKAYVKKIVMKHIDGKKLTDYEDRINKTFFKTFWNTHPELKEVFAKAKKNSKSNL